MRSLILTVSLAVLASAAAAQAAPTPHAIVVLADQTSWGPAPAILPKGAQLAVIEGDPGKAGPFTMRLKVPDGYRIPPHFHPLVEHVTVLQGNFRVGMGEKFDAAQLTDLPVGAFAALEPGVRHFAQAGGDTVIQLHGTGPWSLTYVNPADDPRTARP
jgi:quercetin dioxygenase-like cupin family protein